MTQVTAIVSSKEKNLCAPYKTGAEGLKRLRQAEFARRQKRQRNPAEAL